MLKFALMQLLCDFRRNESTAVQRFRYSDTELRHEMAFDANGDMVLHQISAIRTTANREEEAFSGYVLDSSFGYALVPDVFQSAEHPALTGPLQHIAVEGGFVLTAAKGKTIPAALPLYRLAHEQAKGKSHHVLVHVHEHRVTVAAFSDQKPLLLNTFPAGNEAEALYFTLAPFKRAGISISEVTVSVLADATTHANLLQQFGRFIPHVKPFTITLPYEVGQYPPHADISLLLYTLSQCELPAES